MKKVTNCRLFTLLAALSLLSGMIHGQVSIDRQAILELPQSPWSIGVDVGLNVYADCLDCREENTNQFLNGSLHVNYRPQRWIALTGNVGWHQQNLQAGKILYDFSQSMGHPAQVNAIINWTVFSFGPKLLLRIGQGDVAMEFRYGLAVRTARTNSVNGTGDSFSIRYKPAAKLFNAIRLGYTYWPKPHFGVTIGVELANVTAGLKVNPAQALFNPKTDLQATYPDENSEVLLQLAPQGDAPSFVNTLIGVSYRF